jgi:hypothetical protein
MKWDLGLPSHKRPLTTLWVKCHITGWRMTTRWVPPLGVIALIYLEADKGGVSTIAGFAVGYGGT